MSYGQKIGMGIGDGDVGINSILMPLKNTKQAVGISHVQVGLRKDYIK